MNQRDAFFIEQILSLDKKFPIFGLEFQTNIALFKSIRIQDVSFNVESFFK